MDAIVCYFQESDKFSVDHVVRLQSMVARNCLLPFQFLCLTNSKIHGVSTLPPRLGLPGWWGKLELFFHSELISFENLLYFDLDTVILDEISDLFLMDEPSFLEDFYEPRKLATGIMFWKGGQLREIEELPLQKLAYQFIGDQNFMRVYMQGQYINFIQKQVPGIYSYKVHCENILPQDAKVVCFHGKPWIQEVKDHWIKENWR